MPLERCSDAELEAGAAAVAAKFGKLGVISRSIAGTVLDAVVLMIERRAQVPLLSLIEDLADDAMCWHDQQDPDYCQAHHLSGRPCPHQRARRVLVRAADWRSPAGCDAKAQAQAILACPRSDDGTHHCRLEAPHRDHVCSCGATFYIRGGG